MGEEETELLRETTGVELVAELRDFTGDGEVFEKGFLDSFGDLWSDTEELTLFG